jgi:flagellar biosynthesis/type III secretory pathway protein FliH
MSSSPSQSRMADSEARIEPAELPSGALPPAAPPHAVPPTLQAFPYDSIPAGIITRAALLPGVAVDGAGSRAADRDAAETAARQTQITLARQQGQVEARKAFDDQLARERASLADALAAFTRDRATYFQKVEAEVVQLALAIARQILHREAQLDPLLLAGITRVALEKIDGATGVVLRIHPKNAGAWREYLCSHLDPSDRPQIVEDPAQELDRCRLETSMGTAVIGMEVQLKEIEQGLMDLIAARPGFGS